jgi:hypothetical protein
MSEYDIDIAKDRIADLVSEVTELKVENQRLNKMLDDLSAHHEREIIMLKSQLDETVGYAFQIVKLSKPMLPNGVPCDHPGCLSHRSHPCEGCGRVGGITPTKNPCKTCKEPADAWNTRPAEAALRAENQELRNALSNVLNKIDLIDAWWIDCPDKGGFDTGTIQKLLDETKKKQ